MSTGSIPERRHGMSSATVWRGVIRGIAQVYLQDSALTGVLFLMGLLIAGPMVGLAALLASAVGFGTAALLRVPAERLEQGLYGFNAVLVAIGAMVSFRPLWLALLAAVAGAVAATLLMRIADFFLRMPAYTAPFVFIYWLLEYLGGYWGWPSAPPDAVFGLDAGVLGVFSSAAEVFLVTGPLTGLFVLAGLAASRWTLAVGAFTTSLAAFCLVQVVPLFPQSEIDLGVYGFNAVLVVAGMLSTERGWRSCVLAACAVLLIQAGIEAVGLTPATFPFVLAMWCADLWRSRTMRRESHYNCATDPFE